jgi:phosphoglycerate dehydrogenase-like enzyme
VVGRAEQAYGLMLACRKELPLLLRAGAWDAEGKQRGRLLHGARVLIVAGPDGAGHVDADALAALLEPCGAEVERASHVGPSDVVATDVLVLLAGSPRVGEDVLTALPEGSSVVDACAPGAPAVDLEALASGLDASSPRHAALLVTGAAVAPQHVLWAAPRALLVPVAEEVA